MSAFLYLSLFFLFTLQGGRSLFAQTNGVHPPEKEASFGSLTLDVLGKEGEKARAEAKIYTEKGQTVVATVRAGETVRLRPGTYRVELEVLGGRITKTGVLVRAGRRRTLFITEVALISIHALDRKGEDMGLDVEVYDGVSGEKLGAFLTGERVLVYPGVVDVKVATPPQSRWWRQVELQSGVHATLELRQEVRGNLIVRPQIEGKDMSRESEVVIYEPGTQKEVARSGAGKEHRFSLEAGAYDVYVLNLTGRGKPFVVERAEVRGEETVEKVVSLDATVSQ